MTSLENVWTKAEVTDYISSVMQEVTNFSNSIEKSAYFAPFGDKWSMAENLEHLIYSNGALAKVLGSSKEKLQAKFGKPTRASIPGPKLKETYFGALSKGTVKAKPPYIPQDTATKTREALLQMWSGIEEQIKQSLDNWTEEDLDQHQIPHPLVGFITLREFLLFTGFHTVHHLNAMKRILEA